MFNASNLTDDFRQLTFDNFSIAGRPKAVAGAYRMVRYYTNDFGHIRSLRKNSIALLGQPGSGKTHLLVAVSNALMALGVGVLYFPWVEGSNELRDAVKDGASETLKSRINAMKTSDVLYIDDLFKGRKSPTDYQLEFLFDTVNERYLNHRPILLSSEKSIDQICEIDEGIGSRIYEMCRDYVGVMQLYPGEQGTLNYRLQGVYS